MTDDWNRVCYVYRKRRHAAPFFLKGGGRGFARGVLVAVALFWEDLELQEPSNAFFFPVSHVLVGKIHGFLSSRTCQSWRPVGFSGSINVSRFFGGTTKLKGYTDVIHGHHKSTGVD